MLRLRTEVAQFRWTVKIDISVSVRSLKIMSHLTVLTFRRCKSSSTDPTMCFEDAADHRDTAEVTEVVIAEYAVASRTVEANRPTEPIKKNLWDHRRRNSCRRVYGQDPHRRPPLSMK